jgi:hypothetical protein
VKLTNERELRDRIDYVIAHTAKNRILNTATHTAWQIMHGILAYGREFTIEHDGKPISALDWLLSSGDLTGWDLRPGDKGVVAAMKRGSRTCRWAQNTYEFEKIPHTLL